MAKTPPDWYLDIWQTVDATWGDGAERALRALLDAEHALDEWRERNGFGRGGAFAWSELPRLVQEEPRVLLAPRFWGILLWLRKSLANPASEVAPNGELFVAGEAPISPRLPSFVKVHRAPREDYAEAARTLEEVGRAIANVPVRLSLEVIEETVQSALTAASDEATTEAGHDAPPRTEAEFMDRAAEGLGMQPESLTRGLQRLESRLRDAAQVAPRKRGRPRENDT